MSGPGLEGGIQGRWGEGEQKKREVRGSVEEWGAVGLGVTADKGNGSEIARLGGGVGQVSIAGVWGRLEHLDRCWAGGMGGRGTGEHPWWGGGRFNVTRAGYQARGVLQPLWQHEGAPNKCSRGDPGLPESCQLLLTQINSATGTKRPPCPYAYRCRPRGSAPGISSALCRQLPRAAMTTRSFLPRRRPG